MLATAGAGFEFRHEGVDRARWQGPEGSHGAIAGDASLRTANPTQELLGHSDVRTTMIYTHTVRSVTLKEAKSPLDF